MLVTTKKLILIPVLLLVAAYLALQQPQAEKDTAEPVNDSSRLESLYKQQQSDVQLRGEGIVVKILKDDLHGSRHQRFILKTASGQTLLVAHNIDLAPRIDSLKKGDRVKFFGEYEWNKKGGVIHWTHHDPAGRHIDGWLEHQGRRYK